MSGQISKLSPQSANACVSTHQKGMLHLESAHRHNGHTKKRVNILKDTIKDPQQEILLREGLGFYLFASHFIV